MPLTLCLWCQDLWWIRSARELRTFRQVSIFWIALAWQPTIQSHLSLPTRTSVHLSLKLLKFGKVPTPLRAAVYFILDTRKFDREKKKRNRILVFFFFFLIWFRICKYYFFFFFYGIKFYYIWIYKLMYHES